MLKHIVAVCVLLALCLTHSTDAVRCYKCKSLTDPKCANDKIDESSNIRIVDCETELKPTGVMEQLLPVTKCNKVITSDKAGQIISRDCHFETVNQKPDTCTVSHSTNVDKCFVCKGNLCNGSSAVRFISMGMTAVLALVAIQLAL